MFKISDEPDLKQISFRDFLTLKEFPPDTKVRFLTADTLSYYHRPLISKTESELQSSGQDLSQLLYSGLEKAKSADLILNICKNRSTKGETRVRYFR